MGGYQFLQMAVSGSQLLDIQVFQQMKPFGSLLSHTIREQEANMYLSQTREKE